MNYFLKIKRNKMCNPSPLEHVILTLEAECKTN